MVTAGKTQSGSDRFHESRAVACVQQFGVILALGLIGIVGLRRKGRA